jgi:hypothetical protein
VTIHFASANQNCSACKACVAATSRKGSRAIQHDTKTPRVILECLRVSATR